jgi:regulatory protein
MTSRSSASDPAQAAMQVALRLLSLRARSRRELKLALGRKGFAEPQQEAVLARLGELGYVDDVRFARDRASALLRGGRLGPRAVLQRLSAHGLSDEQAREALSHAEREVGVDPLEAARSLLTRRGLVGQPLEPKQRGKAARLLRARGFADATIEKLLGSDQELDLPPPDG